MTLLMSVLMAVAMAVLAGPLAADTVTVRGGLHKGFGRIAFNWPSPVAAQANAQGDQLVVTFGRPIRSEFSQVLKVLRRYISGVSQKPDGRTVVFRLRDKFIVRSFDMGSAIIVDLIDVKIPTPAAAKPEQPSPRKSTPPPRVAVDTGGPAVIVRAGRHDGFSRLVFDWPVDSDYQARRSGASIMLQFSVRGNLKADQLISQPPPFVTNVRQSSENGKPALVFDIPDNAQIRHFKTGRKIVVDVLQPKGGTKTASVPRAEPPAQAKPSAEAPQQPISLTPTPAATSAAKNEPIARKPEVAPGAASKPRAAPPTKVEEAGPVSDDGFEMRFNWDEPVGAAVFRRGESLWVVFDKNAPFEMDELRKSGGAAIKVLEEIEDDQASVLRIETVSQVNPVVRRDGLAWILHFRKQALKPLAQIPSQPKFDPTKGPSLFLPVAEASLAVPLTDSRVGDNLLVIPVIPLGHGLKQLERYPEFTLLPSAQGIAIQPLTDGIRVRPFRQGVEISSDNRLELSVTTAKSEAEAGIAAAESLSRIFDADAWQPGGVTNFSANKHKIQIQLSQSEGEKRDQLRRELAQFYLNHRMGVEANAVLRVAISDNESLENDPFFRSLRGASYSLMRRFDDAIKDFDNPSVIRFDEAQFWRAVAIAESGKPDEAAPVLRRTVSIIRPYPKVLKFPLGLSVVDAALATSDGELAKHVLDLLQEEKINKREKAQLAYRRGRLAEMNGDFDKAVEEWEAVQDGSHRPSRAYASFALAELLRKQGRINNSEAIENLEKLRFSWRGDEFELNLLRRLGDLYFSEKDYRSGLRTLRQAATYFRQHDDASKITLKMVNAFRYLYLEGGASELAPITAIALYDEFRELTPAGDDGDTMIRKLADRLISVDLLSRAAELLVNQVDFRLKGTQRSAVATKLALVQMLDLKFGAALKTLAASKAPGLPEALIVTRRHLEARALMELGRGDEALLHLVGDESVDANQLRAAWYWKQKDWKSATRIFRRLLESSRAAAGRQLNEDQGRLVLNLSIALTLSGNERGMVQVKRDFGPAMKTSRYKDAFGLIATPDSRGLIDYRTVAQKVSDVENFKTFMTAYRQRLQSGEFDLNN